MTLRPMEVDFLVRVSARMDFFCSVKIFRGSSQIGFFSTSKHQKLTGLAFDRAQVLEWVLHNNCNCYFFILSPFLENLGLIDYPKICPFFEVVERGSA